MKLLPTLAALAICLALWPTGLHAQSPAPAVQATDPGSVVRALVDAMRANDAARIRALFAPDASQAYGNGRPKSGPAFFAWLESDIIDRKGQVDDPQFAVNGNEVIVTGQFHNSRGYRAAANFRIVVDNGRIVSWQMRY
jgi:ketosteroid isomerase-like protein